MIFGIMCGKCNALVVVHTEIKTNIIVSFGKFWGRTSATYEVK